MQQNATNSEKSMSNKLTKVDGFIPSEKQRKWIETAARGECETISAIAQKCEVNRVSWYRWLKDEKFMKWFEEEWRKALKAQSFRLDLIGLERAKHDFRYWETMMKRVDSLKDHSTEGLKIIFTEDKEYEQQS